MSARAHPSFFALDRVRLGEPASAEERAHLAACEACAAHVWPKQAAAPAPLPPWLAGVRLPPSPPSRSARARGFALLWPALTLATAAAGLIAVWARPAPVPWTAAEPVVTPPAAGAGLREKGAPAVQVFVKRGQRVFTWSGRAVQPGDRLRVEVNGAGYGFVSVAGRSAAQSEPVVLYDGSLATGAQLLPVSFRVDAEGKQEILSVIFGRRPVPAELHARAQETPDPKPPGERDASDSSGSTWRQILVIDKETR